MLVYIIIKKNNQQILKHCLGSNLFEDFLLSAKGFGSQPL